MKRISLILWLIATLFLLLNTTQGQSVDSLIVKGDEYYKKFENENALKVFLEAEKIDSTNWEVLWRLSRTYVDIGEHMPSSTDKQQEEQLIIYETSVEYANKAIEAAPDESETYLRRAIANGRIALFKGVFSVGSIVDQVRDDTQKAIELGTGGNETQGIAHYVLGRTHDKISDKWGPARSVLGLGWADYDSALVHYEKAINLYPELIMIYIDYAKAHIEEDEWEKAKALLEKALKLEIIDEDDEERLVEAKNLLAEVNKELE